ncbi:MAG: ABC transporter ATP-binding protein [Planctomycetia bacterium]|nr:ABC transporter ATP-binding protein [Planctomycetia bacterium]
MHLPQSEIIGLLVALGVGLLSIVVPAAIEALVNTVAFGVQLWPVIVLALVMFGFLALAAALRAMQLYVAECLQRRMFVRTAEAFADHFSRAEIESFDGRNPTDIVNRFFEISSVQKAFASLLVDGLSVVTVTVVGLAVLAFYHPYLLTFTAVMASLVFILLFVLGIGGVQTSISESSAKFDVAAWLEELAKCPHTFRFGRGGELAQQRADDLADAYVTARRRHFRVVWRQTLFALLLEAVAMTVLLGLGGWLVISRQLTLGQLVAGELIVALVLAAISKSGKYIETFYDLQASLDKLGVIDQLPLEQEGGETLPPGDKAMRVVAELRISRPARSPAGFEPLRRLDIEAGERLAICGPSGSGKTRLMETLALLRVPAEGLLEFDGLDARSLDRPLTRLQLAYVGQAETFADTVAENLRVGRTELSAANIRQALEMVGLADTVARLPQGVGTPLASDGLPLSANDISRLSIARAIAGRPRLLLINGMLDRLELSTCPELIESLFDRAAPWTLVIVTARDDIKTRCDRVVEWS